MKSIITSFFLFIVVLLFAQSPQAINYQAVARDASNNLIVNRTIGLRISILSGSATGTSVYSETHSPTTNASGIFSVEIGRGTIVSGNFPNIQWYAQPHFAKIEIDVNGGTNYQFVGTSQFLSVPYALFAENTAMIFRLYSDTVTMYKTQIHDLSYSECEPITYIGGELENITLSATGFTSKIYPVGIAFPYVFTTSQLDYQTNSCPNFSIHIDTSIAPGVYPITFTGTNPRGREKSGTTYIKIKECNEVGYVGSFKGPISFYLNGISLTETQQDSVIITNTIINDDKINISSRLLNSNNIELTKTIPTNYYVKNNYNINSFVINTTSLGQIVVQNAVVNITVVGNFNCGEQVQNLSVKYDILSGTTNLTTPVDLTNLSGKNVSLRGNLTR